jgi:hypothetical protein
MYIQIIIRKRESVSTYNQHPHAFHTMRWEYSSLGSQFGTKLWSKAWRGGWGQRTSRTNGDDQLTSKKPSSATSAEGTAAPEVVFSANSPNHRHFYRLSHDYYSIILLCLETTDSSACAPNCTQNKNVTKLASSDHGFANTVFHAVQIHSDNGGADEGSVG